jgi:hypothetical protein
LRGVRLGTKCSARPVQPVRENPGQNFASIAGDRAAFSLALVFLIMTGTLDLLPAKSAYKAASPINERRLRMTLPRLIRSSITLLASLILIMACSVWPESVQAGCNINIYVANKSKHTIRIHEGKVKVRGGLWKKMKYWDPAQSEMWLNPGKRSGDGYRADFNCGAKRRYQVKYQCLGGTGGWFTDYYPSAKKWTTNQTITIPLQQCQ